MGDLLAGGPDNHPCSQGEIRPGMRAVFNDSYLCSLNWIYQDNAGALYVGTAGHCAPNYNPRKITVAGVASDIGDTAFTTGNSGVGNDYALIRIDPSLYGFVDPTLCHWGGPQGIAGPGGAEVEEVLHYGWGLVYGQAAASRARVALLEGGGWAEDSVAYLATTNPGDSGMPLMASDGRAIGLHTHTTLASAPGAGAGLKYGARLDVALDRARREVGHYLELAESDVGVRGLP